MAFKFGAVNIVELGNLLSEKLEEFGINNKAELYVHIDNDDFKKVDEDLFYRNKTDESQEFIPSDGEIDINFDRVKIIVKNKTV